MTRHRTVADVMTTDVVTVGPLATYKDIVRVLSEHRISAVPVVDDDARVLGVVSESDLLRKEEQLSPRRPRQNARGDREIRTKAAAVVAVELMTSPAICVGLGTSLPVAARLMFDHDVTRLVVENADGRLAGIVSRSDLLRVFLASDQELQERVVRRLVQDALWEDPFAVHAEVRNGIVTLTGELERKSLVPIAVQFAQTVDGVVAVVNELTYRIDDTDLTSFRLA